MLISVLSNTAVLEFTQRKFESDIFFTLQAEVISERTDAFHKFLNLIANCDNLLYSEYFYSFLSSEEHNEAVSHIKVYL